MMRAPVQREWTDELMHHRSAREVPPLDLACLDQEHVGAATYSRHVSHVSHVHDGNPVCRRFRRLHSFALHIWLGTCIDHSMQQESIGPVKVTSWVILGPSEHEPVEHQIVSQDMAIEAPMARARSGQVPPSKLFAARRAKVKVCRRGCDVKCNPRIVLS